LRIAQFTESFQPVINGVAVAVDLLLDEWGGEHHVDLFAPHFPGHADEPRAGVSVHRFPSYRLPGHADYPIAFPLSPRHGRRFRAAPPEVVHTHSPFTLGQTALRWARRGGIPVVTTYHTLYVEYAHYASLVPRPLARGFLRRLSRAYCSACDAVVVPTAPIREVLREYGVTRPIHVIPTGLKLRPPVPPDPEFPRGALGIPEAAPLVLFAGRLAREKNLDLLLESFLRVREAVPDAWLLLAGSGPAEAETRARVGELGLGERVRFAGFVKPEEMPRVYAASDVFAFTSLTDTQGLVLTEAKAAGLPAVTVNAYGPAAVVKHQVDGILCSPSAVEIGAALGRVLTDPDLRARLSARALQEARGYGIEATAQAYLRLYEEVRAAARYRK
jgi:glycosyltransferase involved in cell wall biosynthesis